MKLGPSLEGPSFASLAEQLQALLYGPDQRSKFVFFYVLFCVSLVCARHTYD